MKSHELNADRLRFSEHVDFPSWFFTVPPFCHILRQRIPSNSKVPMWHLCGCPVFPLTLWQWCSLWSPRLLYTAMPPCWLVVQREVHIPAALGHRSHHRGAEGMAVSPPSQAAISHCHYHMCSSSSHRGFKRGQQPQLFLSPPVWKIRLVWGREGPSRLGTGFPRAIDGFVRDNSSTIQMG